jgi:hypothetical protein
MSECGQKEIQRRKDGSIDIDFYASRGVQARCELANSTLRTVPRLIITTAQTIALWLARAIRPRATLN